MTLLRVTTPSACGGMVAEPNGDVTTVAPFLEEFLGQNVDDARGWCEYRGWTVETVPTADLLDAGVGKVRVPESQHTWEPTGATIDQEGVELPVSREWECSECHATIWGDEAATTSCEGR